MGTVRERMLEWLLSAACWSGGARTKAQISWVGIGATCHPLFLSVHFRPSTIDCRLGGFHVEAQLGTAPGG